MKLFHYPTSPNKIIEHTLRSESLRLLMNWVISKKNNDCCCIPIADRKLTQEAGLTMEQYEARQILELLNRLPKDKFI